MCIGSYADISVHAPTRGATSNSLSFSIFSVFQSTLPREERLLGLNFKEANSIFQSTLPREERRAKRTCLPKEPSDFNPRSHERSDPQPTPLVCPPTFISIHAPTRGATQGVIDLHSGLYDFNPRSHERSDKEHGVIEADQENFNPRSHERSDAHSQRVSVTRSKFQSTLPREERRTDKGPWLCVTEFQSTLPREERRTDKGPWLCVTEFQSTLPREERL